MLHGIATPVLDAFMLGYHYFSDVAGGLLAGLAWLLVVAAAFGARPWLSQARSTGGSSRP